MNTEEIEKVKDLSFIMVTGDGVISNGPAVLFNADLVADTGGASTAIVYDGNSTAGSKRINLAALTSSTDRVQYNEGLYFPRGIYVDVGSNATSVSFLFQAVKE